MSPVVVFWPVDEKREGYLVGWCSPGNIVVCGVTAFSSRSETLLALSNLRKQLTRSGYGTHLGNTLTLLGKCSQEGRSHDISLSSIAWDVHIESTNTILYRRSKANSMRLYCLDMMDLDSLLAIQPLGSNTVLREKHAANITAQFSEASWCAQAANRGFDSTVLEKINSASFVLELLLGTISSTIDVNQDSRWLRAIQHVTVSVSSPIPHVLAIVMKRMRELALIWTKLDMGSATVQQLDLRYEQVLFIIEQLHIYKMHIGARDTEVSARYISAQNCIWLILNDIIIGAAVGSFLYENRFSLGRLVYEQSKNITVDVLRRGIHWLDNWPAGLKLNTELSRFLFHLLTGVLGVWEEVIDCLEPYLPATVAVAGLSGPLGMTMILAMSSDIFRFLTIHLNMTYSMIRVAYRSQLTMANSLFNLFRGKRYNILRQRLDDWDYDLDQLLLGAMLFTLISFLFPTITIYYLLFALTRLSYIASHACIEVILALLNHFPLFALTLRLKDSRRLPGGIHFVPLLKSNSNEPRLIMNNSPLPFSRIFSQYAVLGSRLLSFYSPLRLFMLLSKGDSLDRIPRRHIRYSYGRATKAL